MQNCNLLFKHKVVILQPCEALVNSDLKRTMIKNKPAVFDGDKQLENCPFCKNSFSSPGLTHTFYVVEGLHINEVRVKVVRETAQFYCLPNGDKMKKDRLYKTLAEAKHDLIAKIEMMIDDLKTEEQSLSRIKNEVITF